MEDYYSTLLKHLDGYTVMGLFDGKRDIKDIVTLQTGTKGRVFFFDQEPMIKGVDNKLWDYVFQEPTIFANSELDSSDKDYVKEKYPNFIDWYFFSHALVAREWFKPQENNYAGWLDHMQTVLDCNLVTGSRQYRLYLVYFMYKFGYFDNSYISFNGSVNWKADLLVNDTLDLLAEPQCYVDRIPTKKISYDNWGSNHTLSNGLMQSRIPMDYYSKVNYITVSETLCIENKKHLTEKVFKPIAAGKPFILAAGYKNLEYLQSYGFETFGNLWNEEYDNVENPKQRLNELFELQHSIVLDKSFLFEKDSAEYEVSNINISRKLKMFDKAHRIALKNRQYFWSKKFYNLVISEAISNLDVAKKHLTSMNI